MTPSELLEELGQPAVERYLAHPTVVGLANGTLPLATFSWWARQNYAYLRGYVRVYSKLAVYARDDEVEVFVDAAYNLSQIELGLYRDLGVRLGVDFTEPVVATALNLEYQRFLLDRAHDYGTGLAAALPCLWSFISLGRRMPVEVDESTHPYALWLRTYQGNALRTKVATLLACLDRANPSLDRVEAIVRDAFDYEGRFWDVPHRGD